MVKIFCTSILLLVITSLHGASLPTDSLKIQIEAINLSEDMSTLSSKNDELLLILYDYSDTSRLYHPILSEFFILDTVHRTEEIHFFHSDVQHDVLLFIIEQDTDRSPDQIELIVRKNFKQIMSLYRSRDLIPLQKIIGDDDIMGIKLLNGLTTKTKFSFNGRYKLDKYSYVINVSKVL
jgi:hypothetical protein